MLTREEAEAASVLATQNALIDLGKHTAKFEFEKSLRIKRLGDLKNYLLKGKEVFPIGVEYTKKDKTSEFYVHYNELNKYIDAVNEFIKLVDDENVENISNIEKLENYVKNIDLDHKTLVLENEKFESELLKKEEYWSNRVTKLREKCMQKNMDYEKLQNNYKRLLKILYFNFMSLCFLIVMINRFGFQCFGFEKFVENTIYYGCNTFNFIYFTLINCYKYLHLIYKFVLNNCILISSVLFGFIYKRYLLYKRNFIVIMLILFVNVGNSLYKSL
tara:strand:+ start:46 stop:867 length:822 start_codon:yes stop_codon:yes gene_type:complete